MRPIKHVIISGSAAAILLVWLNSISAAMSCFFPGFLVDFDHLLDYYLVKKRLTVKYGDLEDFCRRDVSGRLMLIFHSFEVVFVLWVINWFFENNIQIGRAHV